MDIIFEDTIIHVMASHFPAGNNFHDIYISDKVSCLFAPKKPSIIMMRGITKWMFDEKKESIEVYTNISSRTCLP